MRIENWPAEEREAYCGGMFAAGRHDDMAIQDWKRKNAEMPVDSGNTQAWPSPSFGSMGIDPDISGHLLTKPRKTLYGGKRVSEQVGNTMPRETWHVSQTWQDERSLSDNLLGRMTLDAATWSQAREVCEVDRKPLAEGQRKYCSEGCRRNGANAKRRNKPRRNPIRKPVVKLSRLPVDKHHRYLQSAPPPRRELKNVHRYWVWESEAPQTVSRDCRLRRPWPGEPRVWHIRNRSDLCHVI